MIPRNADLNNPPLLPCSYDNDVDVLKTPLPAGSEPDSKRPKLGQGQEESSLSSSSSLDGQETIQTKVLSGRYNSFQSFIADLDAASTIVTNNRRAQENAGTAPQPGKPTLQDVINRTRILRKHVDNYMLRNPFRDDLPFRAKSSASPLTAPAGVSTSTTPVPNGATASASASASASISETQLPEELCAREDKTILTVFGNAPRGKQLFSSLRKSGAEKQADTIKEEELPTGITISQVIPFNPNLDQETSSKKRTFAEVFFPRNPIPPLAPPEYPPARPTLVPWVDTYEAVVNSRIRDEERSTFLHYPVPSGRWLQYGYEDVVRNTLRKTRTQITPAQAVNRGNRIRRGPFARHQREADPLFANAYSSFAPSYESAGALVGREVRERMWWETAGVKKMVEVLQSNQTETEDVKENEKKMDVDTEMIDEALLQEAVQSYQQPKPPQEKTVKTDEEKDLDEILESVTDLIQTLHSYRQLRNLRTPMPAAAAGQTPGSVPSNPYLSSSVLAATPSAEELMTYETLKSSLAAMVATLPPYVLSKFNSDQLAELNISKSILIEGPDHPGTMEEDEFTLQQRQYSRIAQQPPQTATSAPVPTPITARTSSRSAMAYQPATAQPVAATPAAPITYQRPYTSSNRMMKQMPPSNAPAAVQYQSVTTPQGYANVRPHSQRSTHGHAQSPYAPAAAPAPVYATQPGAYQRGPTPGGVPVAANTAMNGTVPYGATARVLSPAGTLPSQGPILMSQHQQQQQPPPPAAAGYYTQPSPIVPYQSSATPGQMSVATPSSTTPVPGGVPPSASSVAPYVSASPSRPQVPGMPVGTPGAGAGVQPRFYPHNAPKPIPRTGMASAGYAQSPVGVSPGTVPSQNVQYATRQVNGRVVPNNGAGGVGR